MPHTFHIPVLGTAYTVETPLKVAHLGISSVVSIVDDILIERLRKFYTEKSNKTFHPISTNDISSRSKRITAYLNMIQKMVDEKLESMKQECFEKKGELVKYFELLPNHSPLKKIYLKFVNEENKVTKKELEQILKQQITPGSIDVNIMAKVDKLNLNKNGEVVNSDALESFKGFAESTVNASVVLSAGMNPKLYNYIEGFTDFYPDENNELRKKIILKVSDYRSAMIQAKFLAKKGLWVSEFRVESGLNCGGHAFATDGLLTGPILEEFKQNKTIMLEELFEMYKKALIAKNINCNACPSQKISYQGGIGNEKEDSFLKQYYNLNATGWGSPFLLVPEATTVDDVTLNNLAKASKNDFYISGSSPLGVPFNNFKHSSSEVQRLERIAKGRPGSPCTKKLLVSNTEFTKEPICTASRKYQNLKIKQLQQQNLSETEYHEQYNSIVEKACLCEGLSAAAYIKNNILEPKESKAVAICPGPNTAYFNRIYTLTEMVKHIYGEIDLLHNVSRSNIFINELNLYLDYSKKEINNCINNLNDKKIKYFNKFKDQLENGIEYYKNLVPKIFNQSENYKKQMLNELSEAQKKVSLIFSKVVLQEAKCSNVA